MLLYRAYTRGDRRGDRRRDDPPVYTPYYVTGQHPHCEIMRRPIGGTLIDRHVVCQSFVLLFFS